MKRALGTRDRSGLITIEPLGGNVDARLASRGAAPEAKTGSAHRPS